MASSMRKSGIPVKSTGARTQTNSPAQSAFSQGKQSSIPIKKAKNVDLIKSPGSGPPGNSQKKERDLQEEIKRLESEVKEKDSAINDLNEKLMKGIKECQVLREENEAARENLHLSTDLKVSGKIEDLEKLLNEKETFIENMLTNKHELERKFEVELDMLKNQHEIEVLSSEQRLEDAHQEKLEELKTSLSNEKLVSGRLREELKGVRDQSSSAEINMLHEELMSTKLRYENTIFDLKQELEMDKSQKGNLVIKQADGQDIDSIKEKHREEMETLKYLIQEKDILISDLKSGGKKKAQDMKLYSDEEVTTKLEELRRELTIEHEHNIELANELWRKKFEEHRSSDSVKDNNDEHQDVTHENTDKLHDEISDLKEQLQEANELQEEQNEILEIQEKEVEELRESNKDFEERYTTLFKDMESKWQNEFSESEIIEKIKSHYEMEVDRLHGDLEDLQNENSNLKTELDLVTNDFDGGHSRASGPVRRPSVTARIDMKAEMEDYKVQLASLERDLQHALNQNERLKLENSVKNGGAADSKPDELNTFTDKVVELEQEQEKLIAERDDFRTKFGETKKEMKKLERDSKRRSEEKTRMEDELKAKNNEIVSLKEENEKRIRTSEVEVLEMKAIINELTSKSEIAESELKSTRESLLKSENREHDLEQTLQDLKGKEVTLTQEFEEAKSKISTLEKQLLQTNQMNCKREGVEEKSNEVKTPLVDPSMKVTKLENMLAQVKLANEALKVRYDKLLSESETKTSRIRELEVAVSQVKTDFQHSEVNYEKVLSENDTNQGGIDEFESRLNKRNEEYEALTRKYDESVGESESKSLEISKVETIFRQKNLECETLSAKCSELRKEIERSKSKCADLEAEKSAQKSQFDALNSNLEKENTAMKSKFGKLENLLKQSKDECEQLKRDYENLSIENNKITLRSNQLEASLNESKGEYQKLNENYLNALEESNEKVSKTGKLEKDGTQLRQKIAAFEKKVAMQEREKKGLEEKISLLDKTIERQKDDISNLKEKCESHEWRNKELNTQLESLRNAEETVKTYTERNEELVVVIEEATRDKGALLAKQAQLMEENKKLRDDSDTLKVEKDTLKDERDTMKDGMHKLKDERDTLKDERDTLKDEMDTLKHERDTLKNEWDTMKDEMGTLKDEMDTLKDEMDTLKDERDTIKDEMGTLKDERGLHENEREQDSSEHERKLETAQKKLKEKDRVLNETKKHYRQLKESEKQLKKRIDEKEQNCSDLEGKTVELNKTLNETKKQNRDLEESFEEKNKQCLELEEKLQQMHRKFGKENTKLKELLEETKNDSSETEQGLQEEILKQKNNFARELKKVQDNMKQSAQIEISRLSQELQEKLKDNEGTRRDTSRLSEENHALKIKLDDLGIAVSKEKEEKYKVEKLKDNFRFQVQGLQERLDAEQEKMSVLQNENLRGEKRINTEKSKLLETLNEYESKNTKLISDMDKATSVLKTTKEKYARLKEKHTNLVKKYTTIAKKYTTLNEEKLNKSDVQVGPDTSVDLSLIVEDLERSKEIAEETNYKLRADLDRLREEIGRSEYQMKAVRKANVVLMKQSRCLYHESEEQKRLDEEKTSELHNHREIKETLQKEKETWTKEREMLEEQVTKFVEETAKLKNENEEYFLAKNKTEIQLEEKASECLLHSHQLERLKSENEFLYHQGRKLQAELDAARMKCITRPTIKPDENENYFPRFDNELIKYKDDVKEMGTIKDFGTGKLSFGSRLSESTNTLSFDEGRVSIPLVFNNEKLVGDKIIENSNKNRVESSPPLNETYTSKDTNLQISRNIINNEFPTEKYLGKTYWDTLEFLKKK